MPIAFPQQILQVLRSQLLNAPDKLTLTEFAISRKILKCTLCGNLWMRRTKKQPRVCPVCHKCGWDRPLIQAILDAEASGRPKEDSHA